MGKKGFAGLSDLVSNINFDNLSSVSHQNCKIENVHNLDSHDESANSCNKNSSSRSVSSGKLWFQICSFVLIILFSFIFFLGQDDSRRDRVKQATHSTLDKMIESSQPVSIFYPAMTKPGKGRTSLLSFEEMQWCMANHIRMGVLADKVSTSAGVDAANKIIDDYNKRCANKDYIAHLKYDAEYNIERIRPKIINAATLEAEELDLKGGQKPQISQQDTRMLIRRIQVELLRLGYPVGAPDGILGANTKNAIKSFQRARGLIPTGQIDADLLRALGIL